MTRGERVCHEHRRFLVVAAILLFLGGAIAVSYLLVDRSRIAAQLANEADLRGQAVSTLASDVRALRAQVKAEGKTPVAPDPTKAIEDLPKRAEVPVPIPGPAGPVGPSGKPGATVTGPTGPTGAAGVPGADSTVAGPSGPAGPQGVQGATGPQGEQGPKGDTGERGAAGPSCPDGYSLQAPDWDPDALVCRKDTASSSPSVPVNPQAAVLVFSAVAGRRRRHAGDQARGDGPRPYGRHRAAGAHR